MVFIETGLAGAFVVEIERIEDERGFFARTWCHREFEARGLNPRLVQCNVSFNRQRGTLRGMHFQIAPGAECKLISCTSGSIYDVILDLRPGSPTFKRWAAFELSASNHRLVFAPEGFAHGFQTLQDNTNVFYQMSEYYAPECARGVRWDDPAFAIHWPLDYRFMSQRDLTYPDFSG